VLIKGVKIDVERFDQNSSLQDVDLDEEEFETPQPEEESKSRINQLPTLKPEEYEEGVPSLELYRFATPKVKQKDSKYHMVKARNQPSMSS